PPRARAHLRSRVRARARDPRGAPGRASRAVPQSPRPKDPLRADRLFRLPRDGASRGHGCDRGLDREVHRGRAGLCLLGTARGDARSRACGERKRSRGAAMSELLALGISHKTAPVELRERVALPEGRAASVLRELVSTEDIHEAVALSTCNRTELYLAVGDDVEAETTALGILARQADIRPT